MNNLGYLLPVPYPYWSLYSEDDYMDKIDALDIRSVYISEINKITSNTRDSCHNGTSNPCAMCGKTGHTFDE